mmetsp:Transcript_14699/g.21882  ORF Transcript_14699/g.21882 Transcript_14699/m.21882 type:complete len:227 (-) Transcript_14699:248-928(-)
MDSKNFALPKIKTEARAAHLFPVKLVEAIALPNSEIIPPTSSSPLSEMVQVIHRRIFIVLLHRLDAASLDHSLHDFRGDLCSDERRDASDPFRGILQQVLVFQKHHVLGIFFGLLPPFQNMLEPTAIFAGAFHEEAEHVRKLPAEVEVRLVLRMVKQADHDVLRISGDVDDFDSFNFSPRKVAFESVRFEEPLVRVLRNLFHVPIRGLSFLQNSAGDGCLEPRHSF